MKRRFSSYFIFALVYILTGCATFNSVLLFGRLEASNSRVESHSQRTRIFFVVQFFWDAYAWTLKFSKYSLRNGDDIARQASKLSRSYK